MVVSAIITQKHHLLLDKIFANLHILVVQQIVTFHTRDKTFLKLPAVSPLALMCFRIN